MLLTIPSDSRILWISDGQLYNRVAHVLHAAGQHNMILEPWTRHLNYLQHVLHQRPQLPIIRQPKEIRSLRHLCFGCKEVLDGLRVMELSKRFDCNLVQRSEKCSLAMYKIHSKIIMLKIMVFSGAFKEVWWQDNGHNINIADVRGENKTTTQVGAFRVVGKDGRLEEHDYSWTEQANVLFIDRYLELILNGDDGCAYNNDYGYVSKIWPSFQSTQQCANRTLSSSPVGVGWSYTEGEEGYSHSYQVIVSLSKFRTSFGQ